MGKLYRFALFGRAGSGKSSILTAMSLLHKRHPDGLTVTWVPDAPIEASRDPEVIKQYEIGQRTLEQARLAMDREGERPATNEVGPIIRFRFDFAVPARRSGNAKDVPQSPGSPADINGKEYQTGGSGLVSPTDGGYKYSVELIDYSGELIDPRVNANSFAQKLRAQLITMDALLVLAEAPRLGREKKCLFREIELLQQAFALLAAERDKTGIAIPTPVAVLFSKWDRRHPEPCLPTERALQLEAFLNDSPEPPHRILLDHIRNSVAPGCFYQVAVSAFGHARIENRPDQDQVVQEIELPPLERPLPSFGLEDAFVWAARCRNEIDLNDYEEKADRLTFANLSPWCFSNALNPLPPAAVHRKGVSLADRFPKQSEPNKRVRALARKSLRIALMRALALACFVTAAFLTTEAGYDLWRLRQIRTDAARSDATEADLARHQRILSDYVAAPDYRHLVSRLFVPRSEVRNLLTSITDRYEQLAWAPVATLASDVLAQEEPSGAYLQRFPNGKFADEAYTIVRRAEVLRKQMKNTAYLAGLGAELATIERSQQPQVHAVGALSAKLEALPQPDQQQPEHLLTQQNLRDRVRAVLDRVNQQAKKQYVSDLLKNQQFEKAGRFVHDLNGPAEEKTEFVGQMLSIGKEMVTTHHRNSEWDKILSLHHEAKRGWGTLLDDRQLDQVQSWAELANLGSDRELYNKVLSFKDITHCDNYLLSPLPQDRKRMRDTVTEYRAYLRRKAGPLKLNFRFSSISTGALKSTGVIVTNVKLYNHAKSKEEFSGPLTSAARWRADTTYSEGIDGKPYLVEVPVQLKLDDQVTLEIQFSWRDSQKDLGQLKWTGRFSELTRKELTATLTEEYKPGGNPSKIVVEIKGIPSEPTLPPYGEK